MAVKLSPVVWLRCYPLQTTGGFTNVGHFALTDVVSQQNSRMVPDGNLKLWKLEDTVTGLRTVGYTLAPQDAPMNALINRQVEPESIDLPCLDFTPVSGGSWTTVMPDYEPRVTALKWYSTTAEPYLAQSQAALPEGQSFSFRLKTFGYAQVDGDDGPRLHVQWGGGYGLLLQAGQPARLVQRQFRADGAVLQELRELPVPAEEFGNADPMLVRVSNVAGRLVLELEQGKTREQVVYTRLKQEGMSDGGDYVMAPVGQREGPLQVSGCGVPFTLSLFETQWPEEGRFRREHEWASGEPYSKQAFGYHPAPPTRQLGREAPTLEDLASIEVGTTDEGKAYYECVMQPTAAATAMAQLVDQDDWESGTAQSYAGQAMSGQHTPYVHAVSLRWPGAIRRPTGVAMEIRPTLQSLNMEVADPEINPATSVSARLRRDKLGECSLVDANGVVVGTAGDNWPLYLQKYHRTTLHAAWYYDDGVTKAIDHSGGVHSSVCLFDGLGYGLSPQLPRWGDYVTEANFRDASIKLIKPAGMIDRRFGPADLLLGEKVRAGGELLLYGWEVVQYILELVLGAELASQLTVLLPTGQWDLLKHQSLINPPFGSGFFWPPPWGQSAADWIKQFCDHDYATFFFGPSLTNPTSWVPWYGNYYSIVAGAPDVTLPDQAYVANDLNYLLTSGSWTQVPAQDYNVVQVWGKLPQDTGEYRELMPALPMISGTAYVAPTTIPEQSAANTWERTLLMEGTQFWRPALARVVALNRARLQRNIDPRRMPLTMRGEPFWWWGYKFQVRSDGDRSDGTMWTAGERWRVMRVSHRWTFGDAAEWTTETVAAPEASI